MNLTPEVRAELRELLKAALPAAPLPWRAIPCGQKDLYEGIYDAENQPVIQNTGRGSGNLLSEDGDLIVTAINSLPALLDVLEKAEKREAALLVASEELLEGCRIAGVSAGCNPAISTRSAGSG